MQREHFHPVDLEPKCGSLVRRYRSALTDPEADSDEQLTDTQRDPGMVRGVTTESDVPNDDDTQSQLTQRFGRPPVAPSPRLALRCDFRSTYKNAVVEVSLVDSNGRVAARKVADAAGLVPGRLGIEFTELGVYLTQAPRTADDTADDASLSDSPAETTHAGATHIPRIYGNNNVKTSITFVGGMATFAALQLTI